MCLVSIICSYLTQCYDVTSLSFSGYTLSLSGHVFGEQRGGVAEILSQIGIDHVK
jgi:hypothetical protein